MYGSLPCILPFFSPSVHIFLNPTTFECFCYSFCDALHICVNETYSSFYSDFSGIFCCLRSVLTDIHVMLKGSRRTLRRKPERWFLLIGWWSLANEQWGNCLLGTTCWMCGIWLCKAFFWLRTKLPSAFTRLKQDHGWIHDIVVEFTVCVPCAELSGRDLFFLGVECRTTLESVS